MNITRSSRVTTRLHRTTLNLQSFSQASSSRHRKLASTLVLRSIPPQTHDRYLRLQPRPGTTAVRMASTRQQPPWTPPKPPAAGVELPKLAILNSLTRKKEPFVPVDSTGKKVTFYSCGVTPYDDSHLGHARNYVSTDIIRRLLRDYFNFDVRFVQNVTDIDDKIILRARQEHLFTQWKDAHSTIDNTVRDDADKAFNVYIKKNLPLVPAVTTAATFKTDAERMYAHVLAGKALEGDGEPADAEAKIKMHIKTATTAAEALASEGSAPGFIDSVADVMLPYLDGLHGADVDAKDHAIFTRLTQKFEGRFFEDMASLNVLYPDVVTRVTEFVPQIIAYVEQIVANGSAYVTPDGSVYFDIEAFEKKGHNYARLAPWSRGDVALQKDGEGALTSKETVKRSAGDFALWKASKAGEPSWSSPWGEGRPGWHIECSVMASEVLGKEIDVHSGGIDLQFPHHDNELAQAEAYWSTDGTPSPWINYFMHMGHLGIAGLKMSKSLKNFITIRAFMDSPEWTARSVRICFLNGFWADGVAMGEDLVRTTASWQDKLNNFFIKAVEANRSTQASNGTTHTPTAEDSTVLAALETAKADLDAALCDSFNTPVAMRVLADLVGAYNAAKSPLDSTTLAVARWLTRIVTIFGLDGTADPNDTSRIAWSGAAIADEAQAYIYPLSQLRDTVRVQAKAGTLDAEALKKAAALPPTSTSISDTPSQNPYARVASQFRSDVARLAASPHPSPKDLLALCDALRDTHLWDLGIYLEDREAPLPAVVRPIDRALVEERSNRESAARAKAEAKAKAQQAEAEKKRVAAEKAKLSHLEMYKGEEGRREYSEWDENGVPTKDVKGEEVAKSKRKRLVKDWERQKKLHEEYLKGVGKS